MHVDPLEPDSGAENKPTAGWKQSVRRVVMGMLIAAIVLFVALGAAKGYRVYQKAQKVRVDLRELAGALSVSPNLQTLPATTGRLPQVDEDLGSLQAEVKPLLWLGPMLRWVPVYGGDLAQAGDLLDLAKRPNYFG